VNLARIVEELGLRRLTPELREQEAAEVSTAHASDLLSDVLARAPRGGLTLTIQAHLNVVAVAVHAEQAGVVFTSGMEPDDAVRARAVVEGIPLFATAESTFDTAGRLYALGLRGRHE
jgi:hypothetical protein